MACGASPAAGQSETGSSQSRFFYACLNGKKGGKKEARIAAINAAKTALRRRQTKKSPPSLAG
jgi:hypothetical protein